jgi:uncharacterized Tic20 family protein
MDQVSALVRVMQASIAPVTMVSGVGLLLLSFTNRLGRVIDRARQLNREAEASLQAEEKKRLCYQIDILYQRAVLTRSAIMCSAGCIFFVALVIFCLFVSQVTNLDLNQLTIVLMALCLICLILAMVYFIRDVATSLQALKLELESNWKK